MAASWWFEAEDELTNLRKSILKNRRIRVFYQASDYFEHRRVDIILHILGLSLLEYLHKYFTKNLSLLNN